MQNSKITNKNLTKSAGANFINGEFIEKILQAELLGRTPEQKSLSTSNADPTIEPIHLKSQLGKAKGSELFAVLPVHTRGALPFELSSLLQRPLGMHTGPQTFNDRFIYEAKSL